MLKHEHSFPERFLHFLGVKGRALKDGLKLRGISRFSLEIEFSSEMKFVENGELAPLDHFEDGLGQEVALIEEDLVP